VRLPEFLRRRRRKEENTQKRLDFIEGNIETKIAQKISIHRRRKA